MRSLPTIPATPKMHPAPPSETPPTRATQRPLRHRSIASFRIAARLRSTALPLGCAAHKPSGPAEDSAPADACMASGNRNIAPGPGSGGTAARRRP